MRADRGLEVTVDRFPGLALAAIAGVLVFAGQSVAAAQLWSTASNFTVPWLCTALAIALLVAAGTEALRGCPLREVPLGVRVAAGAVASVVLAVGLLVDIASYGAREDGFATLAEWTGFSALLAFVLLLPGRPTAAPASQAVRP